MSGMYQLRVEFCQPWLSRIIKYEHGVDHRVVLEECWVVLRCRMRSRGIDLVLLISLTAIAPYRYHSDPHQQQTIDQTYSTYNGFQLSISSRPFPPPEILLPSPHPRLPHQFNPQPDPNTIPPLQQLSTANLRRLFKMCGPDATRRGPTSSRSRVTRGESKSEDADHE